MYFYDQHYNIAGQRCLTDCGDHFCRFSYFTALACLPAPLIERLGTSSLSISVEARAKWWGEVRSKLKGAQNMGGLERGDHA
jgi:hypothetical protein